MYQLHLYRSNDCFRLFMANNFADRNQHESHYNDEQVSAPHQVISVSIPYATAACESQVNAERLIQKFRSTSHTPSYHKLFYQTPVTCSRSTSEQPRRQPPSLARFQRPQAQPVSDTNVRCAHISPPSLNNHGKATQPLKNQPPKAQSQATIQKSPKNTTRLLRLPTTHGLTRTHAAKHQLRRNLQPPVQRRSKPQPSSRDFLPFS